MYAERDPRCTVSISSRCMVPCLDPCSVLVCWAGEQSRALYLKCPLVPSGRPPTRLVVMVLASLFNTRRAMSFWRSTLKHQASGVYWLSASHLTPGAKHFRPWRDGMPPSVLHHTSPSMMLRLRAGHRRGFGSQPKFCAIQIKHLFGYGRSNQSCATYRVLRYISLSKFIQPS